MRFGIALILSVCALPAWAADLTATDLRGELIGSPMNWWENDGWHSGKLVLLPDGRAELTIESPEHASEDGRWTIQGNQICTSWQSLRAGHEKCYSVRRVSPIRFITSGGNVFEIMTAGV